MTLSTNITPDAFQKLIGKNIRLTQHNCVKVEGSLQSIRTDDSDKPDCVSVQQKHLRLKNVGKIKPSGEPTVATVYLKNVLRVELI